MRRKPGPEDPPEMHEKYRLRLEKNAEYKRNRYHNDLVYRQNDIDKNKERISNAYKNDPEFRERLRVYSLAYYHANKNK